VARRNTPNRERVSLLGDRGGRGKERRAGGSEERQVEEMKGRWRGGRADGRDEGEVDGKKACG